MTIHSQDHGQDNPPRRARLVRAAETVFALRGFHAATVPEIAAEAGVSTGLLYRYFPGKAALAIAIVEADRDVTRRAIQELVAASSDAWSALGELIQGWIAMALADRQAAALVAEIGAQATRDPAIRQVVLNAEASTMAEVSGVIARACPALPARATATWLLSALEGLVVRIATDPAFDPQPAADALRTALERHRDPHAS